MFFKVLVLVLVSAICAIAAVDSATVVNTINTVGQVANGIAQSQGNTLVAVIITAAVNVFTTVFGLIFHYNKSKANPK